MVSEEDVYYWKRKAEEAQGEYRYWMRKRNEMENDYYAYDKIAKELIEKRDKLRNEIEKKEEERKNAIKVFEEEEVERAKAKAKELTDEDALKILNEKLKQINDAIAHYNNLEIEANLKIQAAKEREDRLEAQIQEFQAQSTKREEELNRKAGILDRQEAELNRKAGTLDKQEAELNRKAVTLDEQEAELRRREKELAQKEKKLAQKERIFREKTGEQEDKLSKREETLKNREEDVEIREKAVSEGEKRLKEGEERLNSEGALKDAKIKNLEDKVAKQEELIRYDEKVINMLTEKLSKLHKAVQNAYGKFIDLGKQIGKLQDNLFELKNRLEKQEKENVFQRAFQRVKGMFSKTKALPSASSDCISIIEESCSVRSIAGTSARSIDEGSKEVNFNNIAGLINSRNAMQRNVYKTEQRNGRKVIIQTRDNGRSNMAKNDRTLEFYFEEDDNLNIL